MEKRKKARKKGSECKLIINKYKILNIICRGLKSITLRKKNRYKQIKGMKRLKDREINRKGGIETDRHLDRQTGIERDKERRIQAGKQTDRDRQICGKTDRQADRQIRRQSIKRYNKRRLTKDFQKKKWIIRGKESVEVNEMNKRLSL